MSEVFQLVAHGFSLVENGGYGDRHDDVAYTTRELADAGIEAFKKRCLDGLMREPVDVSVILLKIIGPSKAANKPVLYCVQCNKPLDLSSPGSTFFTVAVNSRMRRACAECFASSDELRRQWIG